MWVGIWSRDPGTSAAVPWDDLLQNYFLMSTGRVIDLTKMKLSPGPLWSKTAIPLCPLPSVIDCTHAPAVTAPADLTPHPTYPCTAQPSSQQPLLEAPFLHLRHTPRVPLHASKEKVNKKSPPTTHATAIVCRPWVDGSTQSFRRSRATAVATFMLAKSSLTDCYPGEMG